MSGIEAAFFGTLGRDAETKTSKSGRNYLRLNLRVGEGDASTWVSVMAFDPDLVSLASSLLKGTRVYVEGSLRLDQWEATDCTKRHGLSVMSWHTRLAAIGRNKPRPDAVHATTTSVTSPATEPRDRQARIRGTADATLDDAIPF